MKLNRTMNSQITDYTDCTCIMNDFYRTLLSETKLLKRCGVVIFAFSARGAGGTNGRCKFLSKSNH